MSKKENFNKAIFDAFGVGSDATEPVSETASTEEQALSTDVQTTAPAEVQAAPYTLVPATFVAPGTVLEGTLTSRGDVEMAGSFSGEIHADGNVTLRADATCNITAEELNCSGVIVGDISVKGALVLESTARITGNISAGTMAMARGAVIKGKLDIEKA